MVFSWQATFLEHGIRLIQDGGVLNLEFSENPQATALTVALGLGHEQRVRISIHGNTAVIPFQNTGRTGNNAGVLITAPETQGESGFSFNPNALIEDMQSNQQIDDASIPDQSILNVLSSSYTWRVMNEIAEGAIVSQRQVQVPRTIPENTTPVQLPDGNTVTFTRNDESLNITQQQEQGHEDPENLPSVTISSLSARELSRWETWITTENDDGGKLAYLRRLGLGGNVGAAYDKLCGLMGALWSKVPSRKKDANPQDETCSMISATSCDDTYDTASKVEGLAILFAIVSFISEQAIQSQSTAANPAHIYQYNTPVH